MRLPERRIHKGKKQRGPNETIAPNKGGVMPALFSCSNFRPFARGAGGMDIKYYDQKWALTFPQCCVKPGTSAHSIVCDWSKGRAEYLADPAHWLAMERDGRRYRYSDEEMEQAWRWLMSSRLHLQAHYMARTGQAPSFDLAISALKNCGTFHKSLFPT